MVHKENIINISGELISEFELSHIVNMEKFYSGTLKVRRNSGNFDIIPVIVSESLLDMRKSYIGEILKINGQFRSYNKFDGEKTRLILFVFALNVKVCIEQENDNEIILEGYVCKTPIYRKTPLGREISDILIAVNRSHKKSDYIPCIAWGGNAKRSSNFSTGDRIRISGRVQSREYKKRTENGNIETRIAYEVSISQMWRIVNEDQN